MPKALYVVKSSLNTNTPTRTAVRGSNAPNKEVNVGPANFTAFTNVGTFIKYYKISQLIHTQSIAN